MDRPAGADGEALMWNIVAGRIGKNRLAVAGLVMLGIITSVAILAPHIAPYDPSEPSMEDRLTAPCARYPLGTDDLGRDVLSRMLWGARVSMGVGFVSVGIAVVIGTMLGLAAGYRGAWTDTVIMRIVDIMLCFPQFFLILMVIAFLRPSIWNVMIVIGITSWPSLARLVRGEVLSIRERPYIYAARGMGLSAPRILFVHLLPNVAAPVLVTATLGVGGAILTESGLSFLGLGVQPPFASWGNMLSSGKDYLQDAWWLALFPGLAILVTVLAYNLLGEGLRDALDPHEDEAHRK